MNGLNKLFYSGLLGIGLDYSGSPWITQAFGRSCGERNRASYSGTVTFFHNPKEKNFITRIGSDRFDSTPNEGRAFLPLPQDWRTESYFGSLAAHNRGDRGVLHFYP